VTVSIKFGAKWPVNNPLNPPTPMRAVNLIYRQVAPHHGMGAISMPAVFPAVKKTPQAGGQWRAMMTGEILKTEHIIGWQERSRPLDLAFLWWGFDTFDKSNGALVNSIPGGQGTKDGYWSGLMIYSQLQLLWPMWRKMTHHGSTSLL
jgi:hypothetical protein